MRLVPLFAVAVAAVAVIAAAPLAAVAFEGPLMSPAEVVAIDRDRDGTIVTVEGEAVGEHLRAIGGGRWVNIFGDGVGLGIWVSDEMAEEITYFGDYKNSGDVLRFTGTLNVACAQHGGEFDVHAETMRVVSLGGPREYEIEPMQGVIGVAGIVLAAFLWRLYLHRRDRRME